MMDPLPAIPKSKPSLVEAASKRNTKSGSSCLGDSGVIDLTGSFSSPNKSTSPSTGIMMVRPSSQPASLSPSPPPALMMKSSTMMSMPSRPHTSLDRKSLEFVRVSKSELDRKEKSVSALRSENLQLMARIRELEHCKENYTQLQSSCSRLAQWFGCSIEGVAAESVGEILTSKATRLSQDNQALNQQLASVTSQLERTKGELAATNVKLANTESAIEQTRNDLKTKEAKLNQLRFELESQQQASARSESTLQSLRQQLTTAVEVKKTGPRSTSGELTQLQTEVGRLKNEIKEKDDVIQSLQLEASAKQAEQESIQERLDGSDAMYVDLCTQLILALGLELTGSFDDSYLISQVSAINQELQELRLRAETMEKTINTAELDSKASRETILRLVSEVKKHEQCPQQISQLQKSCDELKVSSRAREVGENEMRERLQAAKETMAAQEHELQAKERQIVELSQAVQSLKLTLNSEKSLSESLRLKHDELCKAIATLVHSQSMESGVLVKAVAKHVSTLNDDLSEQSTLVVELESTCEALKKQISTAEVSIEQESSKVKELEIELMTACVARDGLRRDVEKHKAFEKKLLKAVQLDASTAEILSGEFAHDAILVKVEQLLGSETQKLAERQSMMYSLQRKLKSCRQALESKELHLGLVQKKVLTLEDRLQTYSHRESDWEDAVNKVKRLEKQTERLQAKVAQQRDGITQLKAENLEVQKLKHQCSEQEHRIAELMGNVDELTETRTRNAQQLAEARKKVQSCVSKESSEIERLKSEAKTLSCQMEALKEREKQLSVFRATVKRLLSGNGTGGDVPSDYDLIAKLEECIALQKKHKETAKCLQASLKQLEIGFKTNYNDALTLIDSDA